MYRRMMRIVGNNKTQKARMMSREWRPKGNIARSGEEQKHNSRLESTTETNRDHLQKKRIAGSIV